MGASPNTGYIWQIGKDRSLKTFATRESGHNMAAGPDNKIYVVAATAQVIDVFDRDGELLDSLPLAGIGSVGSLCIGTDSTVYVTSFHGGTLHTIRKNADGGLDAAVLANGLGNPIGVALDSENRVFVSDISSGRIYCVYQ
jgi:sugar lactone lactonase YvrE